MRRRRAAGRRHGGGDPDAWSRRVTEADLRAARWALANNAPAGLSCEEGVGGRYDFWPLTTPTLSAVLGVERKAGGAEEALSDGVVELVAGYLLAGVRSRGLYLVR